MVLFVYRRFGGGRKRKKTGSGGQREKFTDIQKTERKMRLKKNWDSDRVYKKERASLIGLLEKDEEWEGGRTIER